MDTTGFAPQSLLGPIHRRPQRDRAGSQGYVVQGRGEGGPIDLVHLAGGELAECLPCDGPESVDVQVVQRDGNYPAVGDKAGAHQMEQTRQQLAPGQVARGPDQNKDLRLLRADAPRDLLHATFLLGDEVVIRVHPKCSMLLVVCHFCHGGSTKP